MSKAIPISLLAHKALSSTTLTDLLLVGPLDDATYRGHCLLDVDVTYDDGNGDVTYKARTGFEMSELSSTSDLGVDNAEANSLLPIAGFEMEGFTQAQIDSGALDKVKFVVYRVNYEDLSQGHEIVAGGTIGEVRTKVGGMTVLELRSLAQQAKQSVGELDSLTCRAPFGSQPIGTGGGVLEARFPCGFDLTAEWIEGLVEDVGAETDREFTDSTLAQATDYFAPGVVEWLTGDNAGQQTEVDAFSAGVVTLLFPTVSPILLGDTYRIRRECSKKKTGHNSCKDTFWLTAWNLHFRGEPDIPVADAGKLNAPGAAISSAGVSGTGETTNTPSSGSEPPSGGTGGTTTATVRTRGATVVDPMDYGAAGDGTTDDTAAFSAAFAALPGDGGIVRPSVSGPFLINPTVSVKPLSNTLLDLETNNVTLHTSYTALDHKYCVWIVNGTTNVEVAGGTIVGYRDSWSAIPGTTSEWGHCIFIGGTGVTIRNLTAEKAVGDAMSIGFNASDVWIDNCILTNCRRQGVSSGGDAVKITNCQISYISGTNPQAGIDVEPDSPATATTTTITGNHIHHCTGPSVQAYHRADDITLTGNTLEYCAYGFYGALSTTGVLGSNTIQHNKHQGVRLTGACSGYTLSGDTYFNNNTALRGTTSTGTSTSRTGQSSATADHINISADCTSISVGTNLFGP